MLTVRRTITAVSILIAAAALTACDPAATTKTGTTASTGAGAPVQASQPAAAPPAAAGSGDATGDVEIASCQIDNALHWPSADLKITNHSSKSSNYIINIEFVDDSGTRLAEGLGATNNLAAGQAANVKAAGTAEVKGKVSCKVAKVTRYAAP